MAVHRQLEYLNAKTYASNFNLQGSYKIYSTVVIYINSQHFVSHCGSVHLNLPPSWDCATCVGEASKCARHRYGLLITEAENPGTAIHDVCILICEF